MPAYVISELEVLDPVAIETYRTVAAKSIAQYGGRYLARGGAAEAAEGEPPPKGIVVVEFPSMARLREWYASPEYAAAKQGNAQGGSSGQQSHVAELIAEGVRRHQAGQLPEAEKNYRLALERQPDQPDALHLLGVLAIQVRRHDVATELIGRAVRQNANNPGYLANLGLALQHLGRLDEGLNSLDQELARVPDHVEAINSRGNVRL